MNENQRLEEILERFLQSTKEQKEPEAEDVGYLKRRIRPAMELLIKREQTDAMKELAKRNWFGERELDTFLEMAGKMECWMAFRILMEWKNGSPGAIGNSTIPDKETETEEHFAKRLLQYCKTELCWRYPELGRALLELKVQLSGQTEEMETDGETLYVNPEKLIMEYGDDPEIIYEQYLHMIRQCLEGTWMKESGDAGKQRRVQKKWKEIADQLVRTYGTGGKRRGENRGGRKEELSEMEKGRYDYRRFLKKFTVTREEMQLDPEAFDPVAYYYGMERYGNLPMIEPLETREGNRLEELVIAIDTSGSCKKETVSRFLGETRAILEEKENFFEKWKVCIMQCDSFLQEKVMVHSVKEWEDYRERMVIRGRGGTDFRPVFEEVERMRQEKEFTSLKALIYFTDGDGIYPEKKTDYETAFVFVKKSEKMDLVPGWARKLLVS